MDKKIRKRIKQPVISIMIIGVLLVSVYLLYQVSTEIIATVQLRSKLNQVNEQLALIEKEHEYLAEQKDKLLDPEYVKNYARAGFMLSKEGEQIFFLPEAKDKE
jgi:cell division protein DivIC